MSEVNVWTLIKQDGEFVELEEARRVKDPTYVEGAIFVEIDGQLILGYDTWDDVNWLWAFLVEAIDAVRAGRAHTLLFPDTPLQLKFTPRPGKGAWVRVEVTTQPPRGRAAPRDEIVRAFKEAAIEYFEAMPRIAPRNAAEEATLLERVRTW